MARRESLIKILGITRIAQNITIDRFDGVVANIIANSRLGFSDDELPVEGTNHNKDLHISMKCLDTILSRVLVDTRSSLNFMPKRTLTKLNVEVI